MNPVGAVARRNVRKEELLLITQSGKGIAEDIVVYVAYAAFILLRSPAITNCIPICSSPDIKKLASSSAVAFATSFLGARTGNKKYIARIIGQIAMVILVSREIISVAQADYFFDKKPILIFEGLSLTIFALGALENLHLWMCEPSEKAKKK